MCEPKPIVNYIYQYRDNHCYIELIINQVAAKKLTVNKLTVNKLT